MVDLALVYENMFLLVLRYPSRFSAAGISFQGFPACSDSISKYDSGPLCTCFLFLQLPKWAQCRGFSQGFSLTVELGPVLQKSLQHRCHFLPQVSNACFIAGSSPQVGFPSLSSPKARESFGFWSLSSGSHPLPANWKPEEFLSLSLVADSCSWLPTGKDMESSRIYQPVQ